MKNNYIQRLAEEFTKKKAMARTIEVTPELQRQAEDYMLELREYLELLEHSVQESASGTAEITPDILVTIGRLNHILTGEMPIDLFRERHFVNAKKMIDIENVRIETFPYIYSMKNWRPVHTGLLDSLKELTKALTVKISGDEK